MTDPLDFSSQLMHPNQQFSTGGGGSGIVKLQRQMAKQIEYTKDLKVCLNNSIE
jgi:hypothetical protein